MIKGFISKVVQGQNLSEDEMIEAMNIIMSGQATPAQIGALLIGLRMKGETISEIAGAARVMREKCTQIPYKKQNISIDRDEINVEEETIIDTCGTGGDGTKTFNVSTTTAFVIAGANMKVAKHGNRSVSSACGSADVIEALGIPLDLTPEQVAECIDQVGIGFLFAPALHSAMRHVIGPRKEIGLRTIFNVLGPLTNPAGANVQVLGVYAPELTEKLANVLLTLGCQSAFVVYGEGSYDEFSITGPTRATRLYKGTVSTSTVSPEDVGLNRAMPETIIGGDISQNASIIRSILNGEKGPKRDMVLLNASAVFVAADKASDLKQGIQLAEEVIDSKNALNKLNQLCQFSTSLRSAKK